MPLILASSSAIRRAMLQQAGVRFEIVGPGFDENLAKQRHGDPAGLATALAEAKALAVSAVRPAEWVIGSDSVVSVSGRLFDKPRDRSEAAEHLRCFSGNTMVLTSAVALAFGGKVPWRHCDSARLEVRSLSDAFIDSYLEREWPQVSHCVGVFRLEGPGVQLFETVEGSYFTILGMPLLPLLGALREREVIAS